MSRGGAIAATYLYLAASNDMSACCTPRPVRARARDGGGPRDHWQRRAVFSPHANPNPNY
eukprot:scaffold25333_cov64-Phaeocystis_antarctica.AAC.4